MNALPRRHQLANGVVLLCDPVPGYETVALSVVAGRGARFEDARRNGWSHLLEHMVFKGAGGRDAAALVEAIEGEGGQINAATGHERTSFQVRALPAGLPLGLQVAADLVLRPALDEADLAREKSVVAQEIAEAADTPDDQVFELAQRAAFRDQPLGRPILGVEETLREVDPVALGAWRAALYGADRLVVSVAGAVDEDAVLAQVEAAFGAAHAPADPLEAPAALWTGGLETETRRLEQAHLVFMLPAPSLLHPDYWSLRVLAEALGGGMASRLFQEVRERRGLAYAIDAWSDAWSDVGVLGVYAGCATASAVEVARAVAAEIAALARGVGEAEIARARTQLKAHLFMGRESLSQRAEQAAAQALAFGRVVPTAEFAAAIDAVGADDVARLAAGLLAAPPTAAILGPARARRAGEAFAEALARAT